MDLGLKGKKALITGSTKGIGLGIAEVFAEEGAEVVVTGRNRDEAQKTADSLSKKYGVKCRALGADFADLKTAAKTVAEANDLAGGLDILVNNAAIWLQAYVKEMTEEDFEKTMTVNLESPFILCRDFVNLLLAENKKGKIINITSQAAFYGSTSGHAHYAASKGGMVSFTISLAREVAPLGINVNAIAPGIVETPLFSGALTEENLKRYLARIPIGRIASPAEIAYCAAFLASNKADYLTGLTLDATGGMLMR
jgi:3-oxoacyl-[acyl-carrier protein] reductase